MAEPHILPEPGGRPAVAGGGFRKSRPIRLGPLTIGGGAPVAVQSMTNTPTWQVGPTLAQIKRLAARGCEVVRLAVPDQRSAAVLAELNQDSPVPLVADIHFDARLAEKAVTSGLAGLRINPGNLGGPAKLCRLAELAGKFGTCLRVGVNSGSLERDLLKRYGHPGPEALTASALRQVEFLESWGFTNLKVSLKSSSVLDSVAAGRLWAQRSDYPLHLGVTEAGDLLSGSIKSALGVGLLLAQGIGDTIRISLTGPPEDEPTAAWEILRALGLRKRGVEIVSCPTCGRCEVDLAALAAEVKNRLADLAEPLKVAVMGCAVNGPGEAKEADLGLAGGRGGRGLVFKKGLVVGRYPQEQLPQIVEDLAREMAGKGRAARARPG